MPECLGPHNDGAATVPTHCSHDSTVDADPPKLQLTRCSNRAGVLCPSLIPAASCSLAMAAHYLIRAAEAGCAVDMLLPHGVVAASNLTTAQKCTSRTQWLAIDEQEIKPRAALVARWPKRAMQLNQPYPLCSSPGPAQTSFKVPTYPIQMVHGLCLRFLSDPLLLKHDTGSHYICHTRRRELRLHWNYQWP
ncbi:hypothetical protein BCR34DRAFT_52864 [Clohesyomyces aquaticus]|uniref:Uncharacterized protein n=1 Tax=Clohesyomyces aquaticus TaxID=1231657 RepID=A0A1Y2A497_9PLEO|nr:hypothetical protein BCR34DRAFT_52864 [Clohesyomyces aquaticus]